MAQAFTRLLGSRSVDTVGSGELFRPTGDYTYVIRDIIVTTGAGGSGWIQVYWAYQGATYRLWRATVGQDESVHLDMRQVVPIGAVVATNASVSTWGVLITGYVLQGAAVTAELLPEIPWVDADVASENT